jgi:hypothetical protein
MIFARAFLAFAFSSLASITLAQDLELVPLVDLPEDELVPQLIYERCSAFYGAMRTRGLETDVPASILELVQSTEEQSQRFAIGLADDGEEENVHGRIAAFEAAYLQNFREIDTLVNQIDAPNRLFFADRAGCREAFF